MEEELVVNHTPSKKINKNDHQRLTMYNSVHVSEGDIFF